MELDTPLHALAVLAAAVPVGILLRTGTDRLERVLFAGALACMGLSSLAHLLIIHRRLEPVGDVLSIVFTGLWLSSAALMLFSSIALRRELEGQDLVVAFPALLVVLYAAVVPQHGGPASADPFQLGLPLTAVSLICYLGMMAAAVYNLVWVYHHVDPGPTQERMALLLVGVAIVPVAELMTAFASALSLGGPELRPVGVAMCTAMVTQAFAQRGSAQE